MINTISTKAMEQHFNERQYAEGGVSTVKVQVQTPVLFNSFFCFRQVLDLPGPQFPNLLSEDNSIYCIR